MNKKMLLAVLSAASILSACATYDKATSYIDEPVVSDVKVGMSREQALQIAGPPAKEVKLVNAKGSCATYNVKPRDGKAQTYFVSFNDTGHVMNKGYQTCADYDKKPQ